VGFYNQAVEAYTRAIALQPKSDLARRRRALAYAKRDRDGRQEIVLGPAGPLGAIATFGPESLADADEAIRIAPSEPEGYVVRGQILRIQFDNTASIYSRVPEQSRSLMSFLKPDVGLVNRAAEDFRHALRLNPKSCDAYIEVIAAMLVRGLYYPEADTEDPPSKPANCS
jgi:tetratricopeptide (TPR) repeat protein